MTPLLKAYMATVWIPPLLRPLAGNVESLAIPGDTIAEVLAELDHQLPGIKERLLIGGQLRPGLAVVVDAQVANDGLDHPVHSNSEIHFVQAIGGGLPSSAPR